MNSYIVRVNRMVMHEDGTVRVWNIGTYATHAGNREEAEENAKEYYGIENMEGIEMIVI